MSCDTFIIWGPSALGMMMAVYYKVTTLLTIIKVFLYLSKSISYNFFVMLWQIALSKAGGTNMYVPYVLML